MLRRIVLALLGLLVLGVLIAAGGLTWAHIAIRREHPPLAARLFVALAASAYEDRLPSRITWINTATQSVPRSLVLSKREDPQPKTEPFVMSYPSFVLEWPDGRILLVDAGMTRAKARSFGRPIELFGGGPLQPLGSVAERLGEARRRVQGVVFTHLHIDHVEGIGELCAGLGHPIRVFMNEAQLHRANFTTRPGLNELRCNADCLHLETLPPDKTLIPLPDFDGVFVIPAGGHTPGSQIITTVVGNRTAAQGYVFSGDIVNNSDGITYDIPKPFFYRWLIVPEDEMRLSALRKYLKDLRDHTRFKVLVSHDQRLLEQSGIPEWTD